MGKYESCHFSPLNNRSILMPPVPRGAAYTPAPRTAANRYPFEPVGSGRINRENPYVQINTGLHSKEIQVGGQLRPYSVYVPAGMTSKGPAILVFAPDGVKGREFMESENWKELSERCHTACMILESPCWDKENVEEEFDYAKAVVDLEFQKRLTVDICESYIYPIGLGNGAYVATAFALTYSASCAAYAADGDCAVDPELLETLRSLPSDGIETKKKTSIPIPGFLIDRNGNAEETFSYAKEVIRAREEGLKNKYGKVYLEQPEPGAYFVNQQPVSQVWLGESEQLEGISREELNEAMLAFVSRFSRWGGSGNNHLRLRRTLEETGVRRIEKTINGLPRYWDVYIPSCYREEEGKQYPLVVAIHGMSCNSEYFEHTSDWQRIAEERGFFVVFASGYPTNDGIARFPVPHWVMEKEMGVDELSYFRELLTYMEESYRIDKKRIYCVGHSNGSKMTQALAKAMPEKFAAFGPTGSLAGYNPSEVEALNVKVPVPVWFMMGQYDINDPTVAPGSLAEKTLEAYCEANQMSPQFDNWYENGIYRTLVMYDGQHVPMVRYTVMKNCPHTYTAEMAQKTWDEFLCHFSREEDGSVSYRG